jgi:hypothetical protein
VGWLAKADAAEAGRPPFPWGGQAAAANGLPYGRNRGTLTVARCRKRPESTISKALLGEAFSMVWDTPVIAEIAIGL